MFRAELVVSSELKEYKAMSEQVERKRKLLELMREAEKLAYEYFAECELGNEREVAHRVYENIRTATMVRG